MQTEQNILKLKFVTYSLKYVTWIPLLQVRQNTTDVNYHILQYTAVIADLQQEITRLRRKSQVPDTFLSVPHGKWYS